MTELEFHPLANLFPLMEGEDFEELVEDIRDNGLRDPIYVHEHKILDGRNRYRACVAAGVEPRTKDFAGADPLAFIVSKNLKRRHLTTDQRSAIAAELATMKHGGDRKSEEIKASNDALTDAQAAKLMNVSEPTVERAKKRMRENPEAHEQAKAGARKAKAKASKSSKSAKKRRQDLGDKRAADYEQKHPELNEPRRSKIEMELEAIAARLEVLSTSIPNDEVGEIAAEIRSLLEQFTARMVH